MFKFITIVKTNNMVDKSLIYIWKEGLADKTFKNRFIFAIIFLILSLFSLSNFLLYNEKRDGLLINDPILNLFHPIDLTWFIFLIIYSGIILALIILIKEPEILTLAFLSYSFTAFIRIAAMYSIPLNPPENLIPLNDPFVQLFGTGDVLLKDLFFSGHTSTLFLMFLLMTKKFMKFIFLIFTILVASSVLLQHVHYTIDVIAAPFFAYGSFTMAKKVLNLIK